jgi:hypothetical protein
MRDAGVVHAAFHECMNVHTASQFVEILRLRLRNEDFWRPDLLLDCGIPTEEAQPRYVPAIHRSIIWWAPKVRLTTVFGDGLLFVPIAVIVLTRVTPQRPNIANEANECQEEPPGYRSLVPNQSVLYTRSLQRMKRNRGVYSANAKNIFAFIAPI